MIVSYETFRIHAERFQAEGTCDLLICDEVGGGPPAGVVAAWAGITPGLWGPGRGANLRLLLAVLASLASASKVRRGRSRHPTVPHPPPHPCLLPPGPPQAHRLKNDATLTNRALDSLACRRRVLLSGTPLQNRLDEFYGGWWWWWWGGGGASGGGGSCGLPACQPCQLLCTPAGAGSHALAYVPPRLPHLAPPPHPTPPHPLPLQPWSASATRECWAHPPSSGDTLRHPSWRGGSRVRAGRPG